MIHRLWAPYNTTRQSRIFTVPAGRTAVLFAVGLEREKVRTDVTEVKVPQQLCLHRLVFDFSNDAKDLSCGEVLDLDSMQGTLVADEIVKTCDMSWTLSACHNLRLLGLPGIYRLELNDETAVGMVQVYYDLYENDQLPADLNPLYL